MAANVQAFVLLGLHLSVAPATVAERRTKVQNIFSCLVVKVMLGQKAEQRTE